MSDPKPAENATEATADEDEVPMCGPPIKLPTQVVSKPFVVHSFDELLARCIHLRARKPIRGVDPSSGIHILHTLSWDPARESKLLGVAGRAWDAALDAADRESRLVWMIDDPPAHAFKRRRHEPAPCGHNVCTAYHACEGCYEEHPGCWTTKTKVIPDKKERPPLVVPPPTTLYKDVKVFHNYGEMHAVLREPGNNFTVFEPVKKEENVWLMWLRDELRAVGTREYSEALCKAVPNVMEDYDGDDEDHPGRLIHTAGFVAHHTFSRRPTAPSTAECGHLVCAAYHVCEGCYEANPGCYRVA